jgi:hypothetical protein
MAPDIAGPTHPYIGSAPGCWALYGEVLGREYGEFNYPGVHRLCFDTYAVQHPRPGAGGGDQPSESLKRKATQSVAVHLIALHFTLERGLNSQHALNAIRRAIEGAGNHHELEPPDFAGCLTVVNVARPPASDVEEHSQRVRAWSESVWQAWSAHHDVVRRWAELQ